MSGYDPSELRAVAERIARELTSGQAAWAPPAQAPKVSAPSQPGPAPYHGPTPVTHNSKAFDPSAADLEPRGGLTDGIFATIDEAVAAANIAFRQLSLLGMQKRYDLIEAIRQTMRLRASQLAKMAHDETGLGRYEHKVQKNLLVTNKTPGPEGLRGAVDTGDHGLTLFEPAPFGVFGAITPTTNPTSTIICNGIGMLSAGNTVVFNVHPSAKNCSSYTIQLLNRVILAAGGPANCFTAIPKPTIASAGQLMKHPGIRILAVTGGGAVVKAAMNSGKRAICAGPGNPPAVVDATANIDKAAHDVVFGHSFDNNIICVDEKECIVVDSVADQLLTAMAHHGAYVLPKRDLARLEKIIFSKGAGPRGHAMVNRKLIGKNASVILEHLGIHAGPEVLTIAVEVDNDHPLIWTEQMMPVLPVTRVPHVDAAIELAVQAEGGCFHTASMHSHDIVALSAMAKACNCSIFVKNAPDVAGLGFGGEGHTSFTIASPTGEGLTGPRSFSRWRRCTLVDYFRIV